jgi:hypothetical protein
MQDNEVNSIRALTYCEQLDGWIAARQNRAERQIGHVVSRLVSSGPMVQLVLVVIVSIILLRGSG